MILTDYDMRTNNFIARFRSYWTDRASRGLHPVSSQTVVSTVQNCRDSVDDKREASNKSETGYKRITKKNQKPTEIFEETLRLVDELFPERKLG